jgi:hypothetical protein
MAIISRLAVLLGLDAGEFNAGLGKAKDKVEGFMAGAKWQAERMYSEEEVLEIIRQYALEEHLITSSKPDIWFKQFKKGRKD